MGNGWLRVVPDHGMLIGQREKLGLTQEEVAKRAGITLKQYQTYESCEGREFSSSSYQIVHAVLKALELDTSAFGKGEYVFEELPEDDPLNEILRQV